MSTSVYRRCMIGGIIITLHQAEEGSQLREGLSSQQDKFYGTKVNLMEDYWDEGRALAP